MPVHPNNPAGYNPRYATFASLIVAGGVLTIWFWSRICEFPSIPWNDVRLAPTVALAHGLTVYPTDSHGTINTWTYGPLPLLYFWPASWAPTPGTALLVAAILNLALSLVPIAAVCFYWPSLRPPEDNRASRSLAFVLCLALWPQWHYSTHLSDNLTISCGLLGSLVLIRARAAPQLWLAALLGVSSLACKQTSVGIPLAQIVWLWSVSGRTSALLHAARCVALGTIIGGLAIVGFGFEGLWFTLIELPAHFRWTTDFSARVGFAGTDLLIQVGAPLIVMVTLWNSFSHSTLRLPAITWICTLPFGILALLKFGGRMNSVHSFCLWLPPVLTVLFNAEIRESRLRWLNFIAAFSAASLAVYRVLETPWLPLRPQLEHYDEAEKLARQRKGQIWFPMHPLVTLYTERAYYHDEDGWWVRRMTHKAILPEHASAHLPPTMNTIALQNNWSYAGIANDILAPSARSIAFGHWIVWVPSAETTP